MTLPDYLLAGAAGWTVLACLGGASYAFVATRLKRKAVVAAEHVNWIPVLPPVPPPTTPPFSQTVPSADWFYDIPADCLSDDAIRPLFEDIVRGEFA